MTCSSVVTLATIRFINMESDRVLKARPRYYCPCEEYFGLDFYFHKVKVKYKDSTLIADLRYIADMKTAQLKG